MRTTKTQNKLTGRYRWRLLAVITTLLLLSPNVGAQVTVGAGEAPQDFSILEVVSNEKGGLRLPRLTTSQRTTLEKSATFQTEKTKKAKGLTIFNTTNNCVETWNGSEWISQCSGNLPVDPNAKVESCLPYMFTYQTMNLTVSYSGATPASYQWVVDGKPVPGANSTTFAYTPAGLALENDYLGNRTKTVAITCQIEVNSTGVQAADYEVTVVKAEEGTLSPIYINVTDENGYTVRKAFAHVNLGDEGVTDPCLMNGYLFQWGRQADGHEDRNSSITTILAENNEATLPAGVAGNFITTDADPHDWRSGSGETSRWGDGSQNFYQAKADNDPCPPGWKVPSQKQWAGTYTDNSTPNTWTWIGKTTSGTPGGYQVGSALYLPAAGRRATNGSLANTGSYGYYWSSTTRGGNSNHLGFGSAEINPATYNTRALGRSVRCVKNDDTVIPPVCVEITGVSIGGATNYTEGGTISLTANITPADATSVSCQWYKGGVAIPGATGTTYSKISCVSSDAGTYTVSVSNSCTSPAKSSTEHRILVTSTTCDIPVVTNFTITPANGQVAVGGTFSLEVTATSATPMSYKWYKNGTLITGANTSKYELSNVQESDTGIYTYEVSNTCGSVLYDAEVNNIVICSTPVQPSAITFNSGTRSAEDIAANKYFIIWGGEFTAEVTYVSGMTYSWTVPEGLEITGYNANGNQITIKRSNSHVDYTNIDLSFVSVTATNNCGNTSASRQGSGTLYSSNTKPVMKVKSNTTINVGDTFGDAEARALITTAYDVEDCYPKTEAEAPLCRVNEIIIENIEGVNTSVAGNYYVYYTHIDSDGNTAKAVNIVKVEAVSTVGTLASLSCPTDGFINRCDAAQDVRTLSLPYTKTGGPITFSKTRLASYDLTDESGYVRHEIYLDAQTLTADSGYLTISMTTGGCRFYISSFTMPIVIGSFGCNIKVSSGYIP